MGKLKKFLPIIGIVLFAYLLYRIGIGNLYSALMEVNPYYILLTVILVILYTPLQTLRWDLVLKRQQINVSFYELLIMQLKSNFYSNITPSRAGSFTKAMYLKNKIGTNLGKAASSIIIERVLDTIALFMLAFIGSILLTHKLLNITYAIFIGFLVIFAGMYVVLNKNIAKKLLGFFYNKFLPERYKQDARESFYSFYENMLKKKQLVIPFLATIICWITTYTIGYTVALSLDMEINYFVLITIYAISTFVSLVPVTIAGIGTREATLVGLLGVFGISPNKIVAMSLISFFISGVIPAIIGLIFVIKDDKLH